MTQKPSLTGTLALSAALLAGQSARATHTPSDLHRSFASSAGVPHPSYAARAEPKEEAPLSLTKWANMEVLSAQMLAEQYAQASEGASTGLPTNDPMMKELQASVESARRDAQLFADAEAKGINARAHVMNECQAGREFPVVIFPTEHTDPKIAVGRLKDGKIQLRPLGMQDYSPYTGAGAAQEQCDALGTAVQIAINNFARNAEQRGR